MEYKNIKFKKLGLENKIEVLIKFRYDLIIEIGKLLCNKFGVYDNFYNFKVSKILFMDLSDSINDGINTDVQLLYKLYYNEQSFLSYGKETNACNFNRTDDHNIKEYNDNNIYEIQLFDIISDIYIILDGLYNSYKLIDNTGDSNFLCKIYKLIISECDKLLKTEELLKSEASYENILELKYTLSYISNLNFNTNYIISSEFKLSSGENSGIYRDTSDVNDLAGMECVKAKNWVIKEINNIFGNNIRINLIFAGIISKMYNNNNIMLLIKEIYWYITEYQHHHIALQKVYSIRNSYNNLYIACKLFNNSILFVVDSLLNASLINILKKSFNIELYSYNDILIEYALLSFSTDVKLKYNIEEVLKCNIKEFGLDGGLDEWNNYINNNKLQDTLDLRRATVLLKALKLKRAEITCIE